MATWCTPAGFIARFCLSRRAAAAVPLPIGEAFARYRIVRLLGSGGMGEVYLVRNSRLCRHDAVKVLPADFPTRLGTYVAGIEAIRAMAKSAARQWAADRISVSLIVVP